MEQERITTIFGPRVHSVNFVYIYPRPPVASYSNPKVSISSSPAFLYCIMCTCICFMLFRSTCSWPFSVENPLRVATEALNIHLVSCILYQEVHEFPLSVFYSIIVFNSNYESLLEEDHFGQKFKPLFPLFGQCTKK